MGVLTELCFDFCRVSTFVHGEFWDNFGKSGNFSLSGNLADLVGNLVDLGERGKPEMVYVNPCYNFCVFSA